MDVFDAVRTVLAVRQYDDRPVPPEVVRQIVAAAHLTASSINGPPGHVIGVDDPDTLRQLGGALRTGPYVALAPLAIAIAIERASPDGVADASRAIQAMILTAWAAGVGSNWVGFGGLDQVTTLLGVPETFDVLAVVPFGYPRQATGRGTKNRKPLGDVVSYQRYGQTYPSEE